jgi:hypothetical protein
VEDPFTYDVDDEASVSQSGPHQRSEQRDSMFLKSTIHRLATGESWPLRVRNLSSGGLMADCPGELLHGDQVELEVRGVGVQKGTIAWIEANRIGIAFDGPINPLMARKPVGTAASRSANPRRS